MASDPLPAPLFVVLACVYDQENEVDTSVALSGEKHVGAALADDYCMTYDQVLFVVVRKSRLLRKAGCETVLFSLFASLHVNRLW